MKHQALLISRTFVPTCLTTPPNYRLHRYRHLMHKDAHGVDDMFAAGVVDPVDGMPFIEGGQLPDTFEEKAVYS